MPLPNLLIVGSQKCGTTWLHNVLGRSAAIVVPDKKEQNYFNQNAATRARRLQEYTSAFPTVQGALYYLESTPHYFRLPDTSIDPARNIAETLSDPRLLVLFRDPVDRYESAYIHHQMKGRIPYAPVIDELRDDWRMMTLGRYGEILQYWRSIFPEIKVFFYDDIVRAPDEVIDEVFEYLRTERDVSPRAASTRRNDKQRKISRLKLDWPRMPELSDDARARLGEYYRPDIALLEQLTGRDLAHWAGAARR